MTASKVLMVDDESGILSALQRLLRNETFEVVTTQSIEEALRLFSKDEFAVVVSDQRMPDLTGTELLEKCQTMHPEAIRILLTGYADAQAAIDAINRGAVYRFLSKPWNDEELRLILRQAVSQFELQAENKRLEGLTQAQNVQLLELNHTLEAKVESRTAEITKLNDDLQQSLMASIQMMAGLGELHSPLMGSHSKRVAQLSRQIAERMGVCDWQLTEIEMAATLHDIGKIGIPPEVLKQEGMGAPSRTDLDMIRQHPLKGEAILLKMHNLKGAARIVRHHHEALMGRDTPTICRVEASPWGLGLLRWWMPMISW